MTTKHPIPPRLNRFMRHKGIDWVVLDRPLTTEELRSSPGHVCWDGSKFILGSDCTCDMMIHDVAHWVVASKDQPEHMGKHNWGLCDMPWSDRSSVDEEVTACYVDIGIHVLMGYPWVEWAKDGIYMFEDGSSEAEVLDESMRIVMEYLSSEDVAVLANVVRAVY